MAHGHRVIRPAARVAPLRGVLAIVVAFVMLSAASAGRAQTFEAYEWAASLKGKYQYYGTWRPHREYSVSSDQTGSTTYTVRRIVTSCWTWTASTSLLKAVNIKEDQSDCKKVGTFYDTFTVAPGESHTVYERLVEREKTYLFTKYAVYRNPDGTNTKEVVDTTYHWRDDERTEYK